MDFVIVGAGSLGQSFTALLARSGQRVTLIGTQRGVDRLLASGTIRLWGAVNEVVRVGPAGVTVTSTASEVPAGAAVLFTTKGHDLAAAIDHVRSAAGERVAWVAGVQNGIVKDDLLAAAFGVERVIGAVTIFGAQRQPDASVQVTSPGATYVGEFDGQLSERVQAAADALRSAGIPTQAHADISSVLWSKACNATGVFGTCALARVSNQQLFGNPDLMRAYLALVRETAAVAAACGVQVADLAGFPPIRTYVERDPQATIDQIRPAVDSGPPSFASMTQDLLNGLPLEVDAVFGDMVERAERRGIAVPCLRLTRDLIRGIDPGRHRPSPVQSISSAAPATF